jgi:hypothetical protein
MQLTLTPSPRRARVDRGVVVPRIDVSPDKTTPICQASRRTCEQDNCCCVTRLLLALLLVFCFDIGCTIATAGGCCEVRHRRVHRTPDPAFAFVPATNHIVSAKQAPLFPSALLGCTLLRQGIVIKALPGFTSKSPAPWPGQAVGRGKHPPWLHERQACACSLLAENALDVFCMMRPAYLSRRQSLGSVAAAGAAALACFVKRVLCCNPSSSSHI